ncbi:MAG: hypothetical protein R3E68_06115 [Burkholderiaceae bacterium]
MTDNAPLVPAFDGVGEFLHDLVARIVRRRQVPELDLAGSDVPG